MNDVLSKGERLPTVNCQLSIGKKPYETPEIQEKLEIIKQGVLSVVPDTEAIYLFGSYAYGEPHKDSDLDIFVVVPDSMDAHLLDVAVDIRRSVRGKLNFPLDVLTEKLSKFEHYRQTPMIDKTVAEKGVKLYG